MDYKRRIVAEFSARNKAKGTMMSFRRDLTSTSRAIRRMATGVLAMAGIGGLGYLVKQQMAAIDSTAKLSDRLGIGTEALVSMQHAAKISGVETGTLNKSLEIFSRRMGEVDMGVGQAKYALDSLGLSYDNLINKSPDDAIGIVADQINRLETQSQKAAAANYLFGRSGQQLLNLFAQGSQGIAEYRREAELLGLTFSRIDAAKVEAANDALTRSRAVMTGLFRTATIEIAPYIEAAATAFNDWATSGEGVAAKVVDAFEAVTLSIIAAAEETERLLRSMKDLLNPLDAMKRDSEAMASAYERYGAQTGERVRDRYGRLRGDPSGPKDPELFNRLLSEEMGVTSRENATREFFARIRREAEQREAAYKATGGRTRSESSIPLSELRGRGVMSPEQRRMSTEAFHEQRALYEAHRQTFDEKLAARKPRSYYDIVMEDHKKAQDAIQAAAEETRIKLAAEAEATRQKWQSVASTMEYSMTSAFDRMIWEGTSWKDAMMDILRDVSREITRLMVIQPFTDALTQGLTGVLTPGSVGERYGGTGPSNYTNPPGILEGPAAAGTIATRPTFGLYGEAGPEAILPLQRGPDGRLGVAASGSSGGSGGDVVVHMHYEGLPMEEDSRQSRRDGGKQIVDIWLKAADNDPRVRKRLRQR